MLLFGYVSIDDLDKSVKDYLSKQHEKKKDEKFALEARYKIEAVIEIWEKFLF